MYFAALLDPSLLISLDKPFSLPFNTVLLIFLNFVFSITFSYVPYKHFGIFNNLRFFPTPWTLLGPPVY